MIDLFTLWEKFCGEYNTHQGGHVRPNRNFVNWVNDISIEMFEEKFKTGWQKSQKITDDIAFPFLKSSALQLQAGGASFDLLPKPEDYGHFASCRIFHRDGSNTGEKVQCEKKSTDGYYYENEDDTLFEKTIELVDNTRWGALCEHKTRKPTYEHPKMTQYEKGFKVAPKGVGYVVLDYLRKPETATFDYTIGPDDQIIYNSSTSKPLEWSNLVINEFINRLGRKYGKFIREQFTYQTADKEKTEL